MRSFLQLPGYEIVTRVGRGAGAVIYEGRKRASRETVAVKHVVRKSAEDDRFLDQAESEYEVARRFDHPYLRKCLDLIRVKRWLKTRELFLIMEWVEGKRLEEHRPDDLATTIALLIQVAEGLLALHKLGYAHADIKPNNILLTRGAVKIIDFGQSCPLGHAKQRVQGTPDFMAPEQVLRLPIDQRTDVFNLGATMYWMVTGKWFRTLMSSAPTAAKKIEIDSRIGNEPPHTLNPDIPLPFSQLIMECCQDERDKRPWDMTKVISRLQTVLHLMERKRGAASAPGEEMTA